MHCLVDVISTMYCTLLHSLKSYQRGQQKCWYRLSRWCCCAIRVNVVAFGFLACFVFRGSFLCYKEMRWLGMHKQAGTRARNYQRHTQQTPAHQRRATTLQGLLLRYNGQGCKVSQGQVKHENAKSTQYRDQQLPYCARGGRRAPVSVSGASVAQGAV